MKMVIFADVFINLLNLKTMVNIKQNKVEEPSIRVNLCEFDYIFANLFADLQRNY